MKDGVWDGAHCPDPELALNMKLDMPYSGGTERSLEG
jgi:hypothetical protein